MVVGWVGGVASQKERSVGGRGKCRSVGAASPPKGAVSGRCKNKLFGGLKKNAYFCITYY